jgi:hypothetical protein
MAAPVEPATALPVGTTSAVKHTLPGGVVVTLPTGWTVGKSGEEKTTFHSSPQSVTLYSVPVEKVPVLMLRLSNQVIASMRRFGVHVNFPSERKARFGAFQGRVFESDPYAVKLLKMRIVQQTRFFEFRACCGLSIIGQVNLMLSQNVAARKASVDQLINSFQREAPQVSTSCANTYKQIKKPMTTLTSPTYGEQIRSRLVHTRDLLVSRMKTMVTPDGVSPEDQAWVQCAGNALQEADDVYRGSGMMNAGGYANEWIQRGRFDYPQERVLRGISVPGEACRHWIRTQLGNTTLAPIDAYLGFAKTLDKEKCPLPK